MKVLYGALPKESGVIRLSGKEIELHCPQDGLNHGIVYISEDRKAELGLDLSSVLTLESTRKKPFARISSSIGSILSWIPHVLPRPS